MRRGRERLERLQTERTEVMEQEETEEEGLIKELEQTRTQI